jgi:hypothetical protein
MMAKSKETTKRKKTRAQSRLEREIASLRAERDALKAMLEKTQGEVGTAVAAFIRAGEFTLKACPDVYEVLALFTAAFLVELRNLTGYDLSSEHEAVEEMGFDQATAVSIQGWIPVYDELVRMVEAGKSDAELLEFLRKAMGRRTDGSETP